MYVYFDLNFLTLNSSFLFFMDKESVIHQYLNLRFPMQIWLLTHPFVARMAWKLTEESRTIASDMISDPDLDGDYSGGQVDAFRHIFWLAYLTQAIGSQKALKLGIAHEKSNEIDFRKKSLEEDFLPTYISCKMDYLNNNIGVEIGKKYAKISKNELIEKVKETILSGKAFIVKKNSDRDFLDSESRIIPKNEYFGLWHTSKCLVSSNYKFDD